MAEPSITLHTKFRRNMKLADYEMAEAEVAVDMEFPGDMAPEDVQAHVAGMFQYAKVAVYDQLGLGYEQDEVTGLIMETFGAEKVASKPATKPRAAVNPDDQTSTAPKARKALRAISSPTPDNADEPPIEAYDDEPDWDENKRPTRRSTQPAKRSTAGTRSSSRPSKVMTEDEMWEHLEANPDEWFDNRESKTNPKAPDYRAKNIPDPKNAQFKAGLWDSNAPDWFQNPFD